MMNDNAKQLILENLNVYKKLAERAKSNQREQIDIIRIIYFLTQFQSEEKIKIIIALLDKIQFLDSAKITALLKRAFAKINEDLLKKPIILGLGSIQDSSALICYQLLKDLFDNENETLDLVANIDSLEGKILTDKPTSIIFVDDNITSGTQLGDFFEEMIDGKSNPEFFKEPISKEAYEVLQEIPIRICYAIQLAESSNNIVEIISQKYKLNVKFYCGKVDYNNYLDFESDVLESQKDSDFAKTFIAEIAARLYADKKWSKENVYSRLLGYGNLGKLTVFYYNVPKSLIPIFWKFGYYKDKPWIPLFPETQESKKIAAAEADMDYMTVEAIKGWLVSGLNNRAPKLLFGFAENRKDEINLDIPSKSYIQKEFIRKIRFEPAVYIENTVKPIDRIRPFKKDLALKSALEPADYDKYKKAIDEYNTGLKKYYSDMEEYIYRLSSTKKADVVLSNKGDMSASNWRVKLTFNTDNAIIDHITDLQPKFKEKVPNINDFYTYKPGEIQVVSSAFPNLLTSSLIAKKRTPLKSGMVYTIKFEDATLGHDDDVEYPLELTRIDTDQKRMELEYRLNYEEERTTHKGKIFINYNEVENIDSELRDKINKLLDDL